MSKSGAFLACYGILLQQVQTHREKLVTDPNAAGVGLWVHGGDGDDKEHCRLNRRYELLKILKAKLLH